jgi:glycine/D-amino acid oxidase-like deaminating enzyme
MIKSEPLWWEAAPPQRLAKTPVVPHCDVVIVGAGYTGLAAALTLVRAGRSVQVFDRQRPGEGASTRNGGIASGSLRLSFPAMICKFGIDRAIAFQAEAKAAREDLADFIRRENIDCDFNLAGRFTGASAAKDYEPMAREAELLRKHLAIDAHAIPRGEQHTILGTDFYHGGMLRADIGGLHPAKLLAGMLARVCEAGAIVHGETAVLGVRHQAQDFEVETTRGRVKAFCVVVGTNGYTDRVDPWLRRRMVPVRSRIIATAPLSANMMCSLMPRGVMCGETRKLHYYYRPSPDGRRILFGGRDGTITGDSPRPSQALKRALVDIFPDLHGAEITHSWFGYVAMNRDMLPRIFTRNGVRYAAGYCGSGVVWARWAGKKTALQIIGDADGKSTLDFRPPPAVPLFNGTAWFMPAVYSWLRFRDAIDRLSRAR